MEESKQTQKYEWNMLQRGTCHQLLQITTNYLPNVDISYYVNMSLQQQDKIFK